MDKLEIYQFDDPRGWSFIAEILYGKASHDVNSGQYSATEEDANENTRRLVEAGQMEAMTSHSVYVLFRDTHISLTLTKSSTEYHLSLSGFVLGERLIELSEPLVKIAVTAILGAGAEERQEGSLQTVRHFFLKFN